MTTHTLDARFVAEHQDFLQRLARGLLGGAADHAVDDAVQETWRLALESAPARRPRAFLGAVLRRSLGRSHARERARHGVEARGARREVIQPSLAEDVERRLALQEELARALRALPEPQRTALFLRFHEDLPPAAIAARVGAPEPTVKTRITRGLVALREDLDQRFGGERNTWAGLLVGLVERGGATKSALAWSPYAPALAAGLAAFVFVGVVGAWLARSSRSLEGTLAVRASNGAASALPASSENEDLAPAPTSSSRTSVPSEAIASTPMPQEAGTASVRARLVDEAGAPVAGVPVELTASVRSGPELFAWGERPEVEPVRATSNQDGVIDVLIPSIPCIEWHLSATPVVHARIARRLPAAARGSLLDLGELALESPAGSIAVTVLDGTGAPATGTISVYASERRSAASGLDPLRVLQPIVAGVARFDGLPPRVYDVLVDDASAPVDLTAGGHVEVTLRPTWAADPTRVLASFHPTLRGHAPTSALRLVDEAGAAREADSVDEVMGRALWLAVPEGTFTLTFDAPGFEPWSRAGVRAGEAVGVGTRPRSGIRLTVTDASGAPIGLEGGVNVGRHRDVPPELREAMNAPGAVSYAPDSIGALHLHRTPLAPGAEFRLLPGDHELAIFGPRARRLDVDVLGLAVDEVRDVQVVVDVDVDATRTIAGTVRDAHGAPAAGATVELLAAADQGDGRSSPVASASALGPVQPGRRKELGRIAVGPDGRFGFTSDAIGPLVVRAWDARRLVQGPPGDPRVRWLLQLGYSSDWLGADEVSLFAGESRHDLDLHLPGGGNVQGELQGLTEQSGHSGHSGHTGTLRGIDLVLRRADAPSDAQSGYKLEVLRRAELGPCAEFRFEDVTPGPYELVALLGGQPHAVELFPRQSLVLGQLDVPVGGLTGVHVTPLVPLPAPVDVRVVCTGAAPGALSVFAQPTGVPAGPAQLGARAVDTVATLPLGRAGTWTLVVVDLDHGWTRRHQVELTPTTVSVQIDVELAAGTVRVVDTAGAPRKGVAVAPARLSLDEVKLWSPPATKTDSNGEVTLRLPVGSATLTTSGAPHPELPWPPAGGATLVE